MSKTTKQILAAALLAVSGVGLVIAQPSPNDAPVGEMAPPPAESTSVKGTVAGMNLSADGEPNGLLIKTGDGPLTQVNFPPHVGDAIAKAVKEGSAVTAQTRPLPPRPAGPRGPRGDRPTPPPPVPADHPVVELVALTPDGGAEIKVTPPDEMPQQQAQGKVARLNYARDGQVDGAVLDDGTLVHVGPREAKDLNLAVGQTLNVEGTKPPRARDAKVIHATKVNGTEIERPKRPGPGGPKGPPPAP